MESYVHGYYVYKDLWDESAGEDIWMMKIDMLWMYSKMTPLLVIFQERYLESVLCFSKGWCYNLYIYRRRRYSSHLQLNIFAIIFNTKHF